MGIQWGFAMMCFEINESPVEGDSEQISAHRTEQPNPLVGSEEKNLEVHLEAQLEQSLSLQDWMNSKIQLCVTEDQLHMTENQLHMNVVWLEQSCTTEVMLRYLKK